jgi:hypothetical protein
MDMNALNIEESRAEAGAGCDLRRVACGVACFAVLSGLLNASALQRSAAMMEFGRERDVCMMVMRPVAAASALLRADQLRSWIETISLTKGH